MFCHSIRSVPRRLTIYNKAGGEDDDQHEHHHHYLISRKLMEMKLRGGEEEEIHETVNDVFMNLIQLKNHSCHQS